MEIYPDKPYVTETLTCNNRLVWKGKGYSFTVPMKSISYAEETCLNIKLYEESSKKSTIMGKTMIPLALLYESGSAYQGRISDISMVPIGNVILEFKMFRLSKEKNNNSPFKPMRKKKDYQNELKEIKKL